VLDMIEKEKTTIFGDINRTVFQMPLDSEVEEDVD
jgi:hypothetical protein